MQIIVDGVLTNYELVNPKADGAVILLHGWGSSSSYWLSVAKNFPGQYRYYLLDLPGFGGTKNLENNSNVPEYTQFVISFIQKLNLKKVILVGHSFGGQIGVDLAIRQPDILDRLILISPAAVRTRSFIVKSKIALTKVLKLPLKFLPTIISKFMLSLYTPHEYVIANQYQRTVLDQILKYDLSSKVHSIKVKTDIIWGSEDRVIAYMGKFLVENILEANLHVLYGVGHLPNLTHPDKLTSVMNKILK